MEFTQRRLNKLETNALADIYQGLSNNFYDLHASQLSEKEKSFADFLVKEIARGSLLSVISTA